MKATVYNEDAVRFIAHLKDFTPTDEANKVKEWKMKCYTIFQYQMTWSFAYSIDICESRTNGVYVYILSKKAFKDNVKDMPDDLGFKHECYDEKVGIIEEYELPEGMYEVFAE